VSSSKDIDATGNMSTSPCLRGGSDRDPLVPMPFKLLPAAIEAESYA
jgi:hypothetical protein